MAAAAWRRCPSSVEPGAGFDWRKAEAYSPLLGADRSFIAWEWLRRDPRYRSLAGDSPPHSFRAHPAAARFGLVAFEPPDLGVPNARPLWRSDVHRCVLAVEAGASARLEDILALERARAFATLIGDSEQEHLLLSDGLRAIRLDGPRQVFSNDRQCLRYKLEGIASAERGLLTLRRFLALCRTGRFSRSLHPCEAHQRRWILMLRAWDAIVDGANQRDIAEHILSPAPLGPRWRSGEPSLRSRAQRLVRSAERFAAGQYSSLLR